MSRESTGGGIALSQVIAAYLSWITWHSIGWAIINGFFGALYIVYWLLFIWHGG